MAGGGPIKTMFGVNSPFGAPLAPGQQPQTFGPGGSTPLAPQVGAPTPPTPIAPFVPGTEENQQLSGPAAAVNPEQPQPRAPTDVEMGQSLLQRNADLSTVDPSSAQLSAAQNTYVLPDGRVVDARTAAAIQASGNRPGGYYQKHFKSATEDYLKGPDHRQILENQQQTYRAEGDAIERAAAAGQIQAEEHMAAANAYDHTAKYVMTQQMAAQNDANKAYGQYEKDMAKARKQYDVALGGGTDGEKAVRGAGMLFGGVAAGIAQAFGASAQIRSGGVYQNRMDAAQFIDGMIQRDLQAQDMRIHGAKDRMTQVQQMYQDFRTKYKDDELARQATLGIAKDIHANQIEKSIAKYKGTAIWENGQAEVAKLRRSALENNERANLLMRQVIDSNTHLLQSPGRASAPLPTVMQKLVEQAQARQTLRAANAPYPGGKGGAGDLTEGAKSRVQQANKDAAGYVTAGAMANDLAKPGSPLEQSDMVNRALRSDGGTLFGIPQAGNVAASVYEGATNMFRDKPITGDAAREVEYREHAALQPLRVAITGAGAGQKELEQLEKLISTPGTNEQKQARYKEAVEFTARVIAQHAPPDPAERQAYIQGLQQSGVPDVLVKAAAGQLPSASRERGAANRRTFFGQE